MRIIEVIVKPNSRKTEITSEDKTVKINVKGRAENGEANLELIKFLSRKYGDDIKIISGKTSRKKLIRIG